MLLSSDRSHNNGYSFGPTCIRDIKFYCSAQGIPLNENVCHRLANLEFVIDTIHQIGLDINQSRPVGFKIVCHVCQFCVFYCWLLLLHSTFLGARFFGDHPPALPSKQRSCALHNVFHNLTRLSWKQYRPILFLQLMIGTSCQTASVLWSLKPIKKHLNRLETKDTSGVSVTRVSKAPNYSESAFFPIRRVWKCLSSAQLAVKASATSYPKRNMSLNTDLNESSNAVVAR